MPRVLVDLERGRDPHSGLGQFCRHLGLALLRQGADGLEPVFLLPPGRADFGTGAEEEAAGWRRRWLPWTCPCYDLWHATHQDTPYGPGRRSTPLLLTIHDLNFLGEKSDRKAERRLRRVQKLVDRAAALTTVSSFTESQVRRHLEVGDRPIHVVPNGIASHRGPALRPAGAPEGPFLFTIGIAAPKKNFHVLPAMLARLPDYRLVIAGRSSHPYADRVRKEAQSAGVADRVWIAGEVSDGERRWLYENCTAFVFPSMLEGFGLPVLEAMQWGRPIFTSRLTSLPEVGGEEAFYWDGFEPDEMAAVFEEGIRRYASDPAAASARLKAWAARFTWEKTAGRYLEIYRSLLAG